MPEKIYGNEHITDTFKNMLANQRMAHSFLIYGERGLGKKAIAQYLSMLLVCEADEKPCGICRPCRNTINQCHPDIIYAEHTGKLNGFSVDTVRGICSDAYIKPNNSDKKIYIFTDADNITVQAQNSLLKLIEEPPSYVYFIFTAESKNAFLETVLSRIISLNAAEVDNDTCCKVLVQSGISEENALKAIKCFGGNIGLCMEYISSEKLQSTVELTKSAIDCIINRDEYGLLKTLSSSDSDKSQLKSIITMLDKIIRDSLAAKFSQDSTISCYSEGAVMLADSLTMNSCEKMHSAFSKAFALADRNVNIKLIISSLCADIMICR